jgi:hypothetical protein
MYESFPENFAKATYRDPELETVFCVDGGEIVEHADKKIIYALTWSIAVAVMVNDDGRQNCAAVYGELNDKTAVKYRSKGCELSMAPGQLPV